MLSHIFLFNSRRGFCSPQYPRVTASLFPSGPKCLLIFAIALPGETWGRRLSGMKDSRSPITSSETCTSSLEAKKPRWLLWEEFSLGGAKVKVMLWSSGSRPPRWSGRRVSRDRVLVLPHLDLGYTHPARQTPGAT